MTGVTACAGDDLSGDDDKAGEEITLSGQSFDGAAVMANMYGLLLEDGGYSVTTKLVTTRDLYMKEMPEGVDVVPEYVGGLVDFLNTTQNGADADRVTTADLDETLEAAGPLLAEAGVEFLEPAGATDTNAFFVTRDYAEKNNVAKLSDLKGTSVVLAGHADCKDRQDCAQGLKTEYGIEITKVLPTGYATDQTYKSVLDGESQLGLTSTSDGTLEEQGLVLLEDDLGIQPVQNLIPAVGKEFLAAHPDVAEILNSLMEVLTTEDVVTLNRQVSVDREKAEDVARNYLESKDLL